MLRRDFLEFVRTASLAATVPNSWRVSFRPRLLDDPFTLGVASGELHSQAHLLEHLHDEDALDYLDDKLGHPLRDPHGKAIPEDFVHLVPGHEVHASLLRTGHRAVVTHVDDPAADCGLTPGTHVIAGQRQGGGALWSLRTSDGREVLLTHEAADGVTVRLLEQDEAD